VEWLDARSNTFQLYPLHAKQIYLRLTVIQSMLMKLRYEPTSLLHQLTRQMRLDQTLLRLLALPSLNSFAAME